jgi:hypothetical protein
MGHYVDNKSSCHTVPHTAFTTLGGVLTASQEPTLPQRSYGTYGKTSRCSAYFWRGFDGKVFLTGT